MNTVQHPPPLLLSCFLSFPLLTLVLSPPSPLSSLPPSLLPPPSPPQISKVLVVIAVVFLVLLYRLAVAGLIYRLVSGIAGGPSVGDIIVSITGACIQLVAILILNIIYTKFANVLTGWGKGYEYS